LLERRKIMKKIITSLFAFASVLILSLTLSSCGGGDHVHSYTEKNTDTEYLASTPSCERQTEYYYSCECGEAGTEIFTAPPMRHSTKNGSCEMCGAPESSSGLMLALNPDESSYRVMGIGTCNDSDIVIGIYNNMSITSISKEAFAEEYGIKSVTLGNCVETIGDGAFSNCSNLTDITLSDKLTVIPKQAFYSCRRLTNVTLPDSINSIGKEAFYECTDLVSVSLGTSMRSVNTNAFEKCYKLVELVNKSEMQITLGSTDNGKIGYYAKDIHNGESKIKTYESCLFFTHGGVNYLVGYLGDGTSVILPDDYNGEGYEIYQYAFYNRYSITSVTIGEKTENVGFLAFEECYTLFEVINKSSLKLALRPSIDDSICIYGGRNMHTGETKIKIVDGFVFYTYDGVNYLLDYVGSETDIVFPNDYNGEAYEIYKYAFFKDTKITSIKVPDTVTAIPRDAFAFCTNLKRADLGNGVADVNNNAFAQCHSLTEVKLGTSLERIWSYAFYYCKSLDSITIPSSTYSIQEFAFAYCTNLSSVTFEEVDGWRDNIYDFSKEDLSNKATAAKFLTSTYCDAFWLRD